jgi:hypothetical protein
VILEKAWAKLNGNYGNTIGGTTQDALSFLTPGPGAYYLHEEFSNPEKGLNEK